MLGGFHTDHGQARYAGARPHAGWRHEVAGRTPGLILGVVRYDDGHGEAEHVYIVLSCGTRIGWFAVREVRQCSTTT